MGGNTRRENTARGAAQKGGKGGVGGRPPASREVVVSKALSFLLRHGAKGEGVALDDGGWANLADVLAWRRLSVLSVTLAEIQELVATNDKQRFALTPDPSYHALPKSSPPSLSSINLSASITEPSHSTDPSAYLIRASQGHSLKDVSSEKLLTALLPNDPSTPHLVVHGTYPAPWEWIKRSGGLKPMSRRHIHFATNLPSALPPLNHDKPLKVPMYEGGGDVVISGMRRDATVLVWVDVRRCTEAGVKWWRSANGVFLTEGIDGILPIDHFAWVERRGTGEILYGTKPPGGAAAFGVLEGEEPGKAVVEGNESVHENNVVEGKLEGLKLNKTSRTNGEDELRAELKDNWDD